MLRWFYLFLSLCILYSFVSARSIPSSVQPDLKERADSGATEPSVPKDVLRRQYENPAETLSVLLLIGGDIVQKAIAQLVGGSTITPVAFSFGWVTYSFTALVSAFGDGTLMPLPDFPCKVINLETGNSRQNESWVVGRLLRDLELVYDKKFPNDRRPRITVLRTTGVSGRPSKDIVWWSACVIIPVQLLVAAIPIMLPQRNWTILMVTAMGTFLAALTSSMPQWADEKFSCRTDSKACYVITRGNGHSHVFVIQNGGHAENNNTKGISLNLEDLAVATTTTTWVTKCSTPLLALFWVFFLITVGGLKKDAWFLLVVGGLGMIHNVYAASRRRGPGGSGVPLCEGDSPERPTQSMDILLRGEDHLAGLGFLLLPIFFPGNMTAAEAKLWRDKKEDLSDRQAKLKADLYALAGLARKGTPVGGDKSPVVTATENTGSMANVVSPADPSAQTLVSQAVDTSSPAAPLRSSTASIYSNSATYPGEPPAVASGVDRAATWPVQRTQTFHVPTSMILGGDSDDTSVMAKSVGER